MLLLPICYFRSVIPRKVTIYHSVTVKAVAAESCFKDKSHDSVRLSHDLTVCVPVFGYAVQVVSFFDLLRMRRGKVMILKQSIFSVGTDHALSG